MNFNRDVEIIKYKDKVVLANSKNGYWMRLTEEVYQYFVEAVSNNFEEKEFIDIFEDKDDRNYISEIYQKMNKIGILNDVEQDYPKECSVEITNRCNLNCKHCCVDANSFTYELDTMSIFEIIDKIVEWKPENISISGGEPLIREDIEQVLEYLRKHFDGKITLSTNALLIDKDNIKVLKKCVDYFEISLDGVDEKSCSQIRGEGVFKQVLEKVKFLQQEGCKKISLSMVVSDKNEEIEDDFKKLNKELGTFPVIRLLSFIGRGKREKNELTSLPEEAVYIPKLFYNSEQPFVFWGNCLKKNNKKMINASGGVYSCPLIFDDKYQETNIFKVDDLEFVTNKKLHQLREDLLNKNNECRYCKVSQFCWNCLATIKEYTENNVMKDYCKKVKKFYFKVVWGEEEC